MLSKVEGDEISLDGNPPVPTKREEGEGEGEEGEGEEEEEEGEEGERAVEGEMVKELEAKRLGGWNVPVPRRDEELVSPWRMEEGDGTLLDEGSTLPVPAPLRKEPLLLERKRVEVDKGMEFKVVKETTGTGAAVCIDKISSVNEDVMEEVEVGMNDRGAADGNVDDSEVVIFCG